MHTFVLFVNLTSFHAPLPPSHLRPLRPHCADVLKLTRSTLHGHSDIHAMSISLYKTCCVIFICILGNKVFISYPVTCYYWYLDDCV
jgi:hypothetical protein